MRPEDHDPAAEGPDVLDGAVVDGLLQLDDGAGVVFDELATTFLDATTGSSAQLRRAVAAGDADAVARVAHSLKGSSGMFGAKRVEGICREIEQSARAGEVAGASELADRLEGEVHRVRGALRNAGVGGDAGEGPP